MKETAMKYLLLLPFVCLVGCVHQPYSSFHNMAQDHIDHLNGVIDRTIMQHDNYDLMQGCMDEWHHECIVLMKP
jgi:hypothetical protein